MKKWLATPISRLRAIGFIEGISYLLLLFIAMPLKYLAGMPMAVKITGSAHGFLFVLFVIALAQVYFSRKWSFLKGTAAFISSLIPFGTFILDAKLRDEEEGISNPNVSAGAV